MDPTEQRLQMVKTQLLDRGIRDPRVLDAFASVPRHEFVPTPKQAEAYADAPAAGHVDEDRAFAGHRDDQRGSSAL